jgi:tetratricopeptide (TPR) repeat protein
VSSIDATPGSATTRASLLHREVLQLGGLLVLAIGAFFLTRAVASNNRDTTLRDAAEWYRRGQVEMAGGHLDDAIESLRRATVRNRGDRRYALTLARALTLKGDYDAARARLLTLRDFTPDDPDINLQLARLAADRRDVTEALRFYRSALYAPWPPEQFPARPQIRLELIRFLLAHDQTGRAQSELLAMATELPDDIALRVEAAELFVTAGDTAHALEQFQHALRIAPDNALSLVGAGQAAFRLGNYALARTYLQRAPAAMADAGKTREVVELVLSMDPLAGRIGSTERRRRLLTAFSYAQQRLDGCIAESAGDPGANEGLGIRDDVRRFAGQLKPTALLEQDAVEAGLDLIERIEQHVTARCAPTTVLDQALVLIGRVHGAAGR